MLKFKLKGNKVKEPEHITRLHEELAQLCDRLDKLTKFEMTDQFKTLNNYQKDLLVAQYGAMLAYRNVLNIRTSYEEQVFKAKAAAAPGDRKEAKK
jgi:hypothetical protein